MLSLKNVQAIFMKQIKDIGKNTQVLVLFFVYPLIAFIMNSSIPAEVGQERFFITIFSTMHSVFTPLVVTASIIAEEKEKNTLRVLMMSNVKPVEYLLSIGGFVLIGTLATGSLFIAIDSYSLSEVISFLVAMIVGSSISILLGLSIGAYAPNMMSANGLAVPLAMLFAFLPMLASFNEKVKQVASVAYSQQISQIIEKLGTVSTQSIIVILINGIVFFCVFLIIFKKNKLES